MTCPRWTRCSRSRQRLATALDACRYGLQALVIEDACRAIDSARSLAAAWRAMDRAGVKRLAAASLLCASD